MKSSLFTTAYLAFGLIAPLSAQNLTKSFAALDEDSSLLDAAARPPLAPIETPEIVKAKGIPTNNTAVYSNLDLHSMGPRLIQTKGIDEVVDFSVLKKRSPFRSVAMGKNLSPNAIPAKSIKEDLAVISAAYREAGKPDADCPNISLSVEQRIKLDPSSTLEIVEVELQANSSCACEIVKSAIKASEADVPMVVAIVETSILAAPETMNLAAQCAIAAMPEALAGIQALLAKYDSNAGDTGTSAKSSKSAKDSKSVIPDSVASMGSPLDFPGGPGGGPPGPGPIPVPPLPPPIIVPPVSTTGP
jgi:hypothetical protein